MIRRRFACAAIGNELKGYLLAFVETVQPGALYGADVNEDVLRSIIWLDESEAFLSVEPLDSSLRHNLFLSCMRRRATQQRDRYRSEIGKKVISLTRKRAKAKSFGRTRYQDASRFSSAPQGKQRSNCIRLAICRADAYIH